MSTRSDDLPTGIAIAIRHWLRRSSAPSRAGCCSASGAASALNKVTSIAWRNCRIASRRLKKALVREALESIDRLLNGLPERVRQTFILSRLEGLSQPAIAQQLGVSLATVERDLRRAFLHCLAESAELA